MKHFAAAGWFLLVVRQPADCPVPQPTAATYAINVELVHVSQPLQTMQEFSGKTFQRTRKTINGCYKINKKRVERIQIKLLQNVKIASKHKVIQKNSKIVSIILKGPEKKIQKSLDRIVND